MMKTDTIRQKVAAEQIEAAMRERGLNRKQLADLMHKNPSEITKWLSGKHNFTIALLQQISDVLCTPITGVEDVDCLVDGYTTDLDEAHLEDGAGSLSAKIKLRSSQLGISARIYLERLVDEDMQRSGELPKVVLPAQFNPIVTKFAGIMRQSSQEDPADTISKLAGDGSRWPSEKELAEDDRLRWIWER